MRIEDKSDYYIHVSDEIVVNQDYFEIGTNKKYCVKVIKNPNKMLSLYVKYGNKKVNNSIKIAIMGTCFSRNAFNSSNYFNPGYKEVFDCVFTQFHSSIISLMTEPVSFNLDKYTDLTINEKGFVNADFNKTFFDNLISSKADYLIIDLYCDAIRPLIWINNKQAVTLSYLVENSKLLNDLNIQSILDHLDNDKYFNIWKMYLDKFVERLIKIIPSERIILNMGRFALEYYDNERKKSKYPNAMMIKRNNYFWDKLDNYFLAKVPDAKVLDIQKYPLIGDVKYPYGHSFSHYESNYYKLFLKELALLILRDRLNS